MNIVVRRREPGRRMARFYHLTMQLVLDVMPPPSRARSPDAKTALPVRVHLVREWGRIGSPGTIMIDAHATPETAEKAAAAVVARKRRKGYS